MKRVGMACLGLLAVSLWFTAVYAQPHFAMRTMGPRGMMDGGLGIPLPMLLKGVDLTPEQQARVHEIMEASRPQFRDLFKQLREVHEAMANKLFSPGEVDAAELTAQLQHGVQLRAQLMQEGLKVALEVRNLLTPEQLARAAQLKERMKDLRTEMRNLFKKQP